MDLRKKAKCNCVEDFYKDFPKRILELKPELQKVTDVRNDNVALFSNKTFSRLEVTHVITDKKGYEKRKTYKTILFHNFCPFCGTEYID